MTRGRVRRQTEGASRILSPAPPVDAPPAGHWSACPDCGASYIRTDLPLPLCTHYGYVAPGAKHRTAYMRCRNIDCGGKNGANYEVREPLQQPGEGK
jgi:hypothetical protein